MAGQEPVIESDGQAPEGGQETKTFDAGYVKQLRDEAAAYRRKVKELEGKVSSFEQAQMTETEKLRAQAEAAAKQAAAAQEALRQARATAAISREAARHQVDPDLLARLVDVQFDDDGEPAGVDAAVEQVLSRYPNLRPAAGVNMASTNPQRKPVDARGGQTDVARRDQPTLGRGPVGAEDGQVTGGPDGHRKFHPHDLECADSPESSQELGVRPGGRDQSGL